jgi:hypothetical protein
VSEGAAKKIVRDEAVVEVEVTVGGAGTVKGDEDGEVLDQGPAPARLRARALKT